MQHRVNLTWKIYPIRTIITRKPVSFLRLPTSKEKKNTRNFPYLILKQPNHIFKMYNNIKGGVAT
jgi:hypothetical protein